MWLEANLLSRLRTLNLIRRTEIMESAMGCCWVLTGIDYSTKVDDILFNLKGTGLWMIEGMHTLWNLATLWRITQEIINTLTAFLLATQRMAFRLIYQTVDSSKLADQRVNQSKITRSRLLYFGTLQEPWTNLNHFNWFRQGLIKL